MAEPTNTSSWWLPSLSDIMKGHTSTPYDWSGDSSKGLTSPIIPPSHAQSEQKSMADFDTYLKSVLNAKAQPPDADAGGTNPVNWGGGQQMPSRPGITQGARGKTLPVNVRFPGAPMGALSGSGAQFPTPQSQAAPPQVAQPTNAANEVNVTRPTRPGQQFSGKIPLPPTRQPTPAPQQSSQPGTPAGMHKVWYDKNMRRAGVGDTPPSGVAEDAFEYEPNQMTGWQRFVRGAYDIPQAASGGAIEAADKVAKEAETPYHHGIIHMAVGGRTDHVPMNVLEGSYVLPADIVSGLGEGNTLAGSKILDKMFSTGPAGVKIPDFRMQPNFPKVGQAPAGGSVTKAAYGALPGAKDGGSISKGRRTIPIIAAGGEYVIHPDAIRAYGDGDLDKGHEKLDHFVKYVRSHTVKTLKNLPGPKKN